MVASETNRSTFCIARQSAPESGLPDVAILVDRGIAEMLRELGIHRCQRGDELDLVRVLDDLYSPAA